MTLARYVVELSLCALVAVAVFAVLISDGYW